MSASEPPHAAPEKAALSPKAPDLSEEDIQYREREPIVQTLRLALGHVGPDVRAKLFAAEVGVYRGRSLALLATELSAARAAATIAGYDSFAGLPELSERDIALAAQQLQQRRTLMYSDTSRREVEAFLAPHDRDKLIELHEGPLAKTLPATPDRRYFFVNVSCKLHSSTDQALAYFYPRMASGGVMLFDDYLDKSWNMARIAVDEFFIGKPEVLYQIQCGDGMSSFRKTFVVKQ